MAKAENLSSLTTPGEKKIVNCTEAIAQGAFEAGIAVITGFPGTPSSEILKTLTELTKKEKAQEIEIEWSINEKVAFEIALAASMCNARAMTVLKQTGINIAADSFMTACYAGAFGGLVIITTDDPSIQISQNAQDNRYYGLHGLIPVFEPKSVTEAKEMLKYAFDFSEQYETMVLFRITSEIIKISGEIEIQPNTIIERPYKFDEKQRDRWTHLPTNARVNRVKLLDRLEKITQHAENLPFNTIKNSDNAKIGIISSGFTSAKIEEALQELKLNKIIAHFQLGMSYPLPKIKLATFLNEMERIIVIEESEPILEEAIKVIAFDAQLSTKIFGRKALSTPNTITTEWIQNNLVQLFNIKSQKSEEYENASEKNQPAKLIVDNNNSTAFEVNNNIFSAIEIFEKKHNIRLIHLGEMGINANYNPKELEEIDNYISMGASAGIANGISKLSKQPVLAYLTDISFYHSGISGLINAVYNENDMICIIVESELTCELYHRPNQKFNFQKVLKGIGIPEGNIKLFDIDNVEAIEAAIEEIWNQKGVRILIPNSIASGCDE